MEMTFSSVEFQSDLFALANDTTFEEKVRAVPSTTTETLDTEKKVVINMRGETDTVFDADTVKAKITKSIHIEGFEGKYYVEDNTAGTEEKGDTTYVDWTITVGDVADGKYPVTITYAQTEDVPETVTVHYDEYVKVPVIDLDNTKTAVGELILKYPKKKWAA